MVNPTNPSLVISGWNDYCSDWMGLGFSTDGGAPGPTHWSPATPPTRRPRAWRHRSTCARTPRPTPSPPSAGTATYFYFGSISYNGFAGPKTNSDVWVARYAVRATTDPMYDAVPARLPRHHPRREAVPRLRTSRAASTTRRWSRSTAPAEPPTATSTCAGRSSPRSARARSTSAARPTTDAPSARESRSARRVRARAVTSPSSTTATCTSCGATSSSRVRRRTTASRSVRSADGGATFGKPRKVPALPQYTPVRHRPRLRRRHRGVPERLRVLPRPARAADHR